MAISPEAGGIVRAIEGKLRRHFGRDLESATKEQIFRALALTLRDVMSSHLVQTRDQLDRTLETREVHYLSLEFLLGRSLHKNAYNLGLLDTIREAIGELGFDPDDIFETEPDAGLGNGGLGRLAACYLDSMTTLGLPATGYSICYQFGIFKQKIIDGQQVELPDPWMEVGDVWLTSNMDKARSVHFGGHLVERWEDGRMTFEHVEYTEVLAVPMDMLITGYGTDHVNTLRLWNAKSPTAIDMTLFSRGEYMKAIEQNAMAEVIAKILYPNDNHFEGKLLRLRQQYFFVSATIQDIVQRHYEKYGTMDNFHLKHAIHVNDTHPTLAIPELMRILLDEFGMDWDKAWQIVTHTFSYTNHTVLVEAMETWPQQLIEMLLPRIWKILCEINDRYLSMLRNLLGDEYRVSQMAVIWDGQVRMAKLCVYACYAVNGVSSLHSGILRQQTFRDEYALWPTKFLNVTNGVDHRRWLAQINPRLHGLICELNGSDSYLLHPDHLRKLAAFSSDSGVLSRLAEVKRKNKIDFSNYLTRAQGLLIDPDSLFDVQVKRLHEYKRQLLNVLHIVHLYQRLCDEPSLDISPRTFFFGAKAASGYYMAKRIIRLIQSVAAEISANPAVRAKLNVVFLENYRVSLAERLMPASEISEQISIAGKEASGTGNMKFMLNGALTVGTLDGANVEITEFVRQENIFIFGLRADEVEALWREGYNPMPYYQRSADLRRVLDKLSAGFSDGESYGDIVNALLMGQNGHADSYMLMADYQSYADIHQAIELLYRERTQFMRMSLINISQSGYFAADRSIEQYAHHIWNIGTGK